MNGQMMLFEGHHEVMILFKQDVKIDFQGDFLIRAKDVAVVLEYQGTSATQEVLKFVKPEQVVLVKNSDMANHHIRKLNNAGESFITNLALNRVLGKSEKPKAEPFQDWLYEDMLPAVQKHGAYMTPAVIEKTLNDPDFIIGIVTRLKEEQQARVTAEKVIESQRPKVIFADSVTASRDCILVRELATILKQNGVDFGERRLFNWLRENGYLVKRKGTDYNMPTQKSMEMGLFWIKETTVTHSDGRISITKTPKVTGKGQVYFINKLKDSIVA